MTEPKLCSDCQRPIVSGDNAECGTVASHCFAHRVGDFLGERWCRDYTITRLRSALEASQAEVERLKETLSATHELMLRYESERNHCRGRALSPAATSAELAVDLEGIRFLLKRAAQFDSVFADCSHERLARIEDALGLGEQKGDDDEKR